MVRMTRMLRSLLLAFAIVAGVGAPVQAAGTLPIVLQQQFSFSGCATTGAVCGTPLNGGLLYFFQSGTVSTPQDSFQDTALTLKNPWPLTLDANGRVPPFYLADGAIHIRLTDSAGLPQFDYPSMLVIGPSSGGGGGGGTVDPTTIFATGDIKFRPTSEVITGWVKLNGLTIGSAISGASGRANNDTQNLYVYLWTNCTNSHCAVLGGRGATALADFNANKQITLPDWRARIPVGLDDMGNTPAGILLSGNITSPGDTPTTPGAGGGTTSVTVAQANLPNVNLSSASLTLTGITGTGSSSFLLGGGANGVTTNGSPGVIGGTVPLGGSGTPIVSMPPFMLGSWHAKL